MSATGSYDDEDDSQDRDKVNNDWFFDETNAWLCRQFIFVGLSYQKSHDII